MRAWALLAAVLCAYVTVWIFSTTMIPPAMTLSVPRPLPRTAVMRSLAHALTPPFPKGVRPFQLLSKKPAGANSYVMRFALPAVGEPADPAASLGSHGVKYFVNGEKEGAPGVPAVLQKSYSPLQLASQQGYFDLLVKAYEYRPGGGVAAHLANLNVGEAGAFKVKNLRDIHGIHALGALVTKYKHIGLIAGGSGLAPLYQIAREALDGAGAAGRTTVSLLFVNRHEEDILMRDALDALVRAHGPRFTVTHSLTAAGPGWAGGTGRGGPALAMAALPPPGDDTLVLVCGTDGFVATWAGAKEKVDGVKTQGPLRGFLKDAGYTGAMVYKY